jgi:hypothetical protein
MKTTRKLILDGESYEAALIIVGMLEEAEEQCECIVKDVLNEAIDEYESRYYPIDVEVDDDQ